MDFVKIGMTEGDVHERMHQLTNAPGSLGEHQAVYFRRVENPAEVEDKLHKKFHFCRLQGTEYFVVGWQAVKAALEMFPTLIPQPPAVQTPPEPQPCDAFITALMNCNSPAIEQLIAGGMCMNLDDYYGWPNLPGEPVQQRARHGHLYIGKLLAQNPECLMGQQGRPIIKALMVAYIRQNPGTNNTLIFQHLGIRTMHVNGGHNDMFAYGILTNLESVENQGQPRHPEWHVADE